MQTKDFALLTTQKNNLELTKPLKLQETKPTLRIISIFFFSKVNKPQMKLEKQFHLQKLHKDFKLSEIKLTKKVEAVYPGK